MKHDSIKNIFVLATGILAGIFVLTLMVFSPSQNAAALSVSDEVHRRMTEAALELESLPLATNGSAGFVENETSEELLNEGYLLNEDMVQQFFDQYWKSSDSSDTTNHLNPTSTVSLSPDAVVESIPETSELSVANGSKDIMDENLDQESSIYQKSNVESENDLNVNSLLTDDDRFYGNERDLRFIENTPIVKSPTPTLMPQATLQPTSLPTSIPTTQSTLVPTKEATPVPTQTQVPTQEPTIEPTLVPTQEPTDTPEVFWSARFETGDISEWTAHGDWIHQGNTPVYSVQKQQVHSGEYAVKFTIDTSSGKSQAAYLFYWDTLPNAAYYSAWYYIPGNIDTEAWWNIMQWKSTYDGNTDHSRPIFVIDGALFGQTALSLCYLPDRDEDKHCWKQTEVQLPQDQWVHIEVYYERNKVNGHVIVWQDGVQLFDVTGYPTVLSDGTLYYSVNHYTDGISPDVSSIYIDDVVISYDRVGQ